jgi:hypothetical protein
MFIQDFAVPLANFENMAGKAASHGVGRQQIIALDAVLVGGELNTDHTYSPRESQPYDNPAGVITSTGSTSAQIKSPLVLASGLCQ